MGKEMKEEAVKWALWNKILNLLRKYKGQEEVDPKNNPYGYRSEYDNLGKKDRGN